MLYHPRYSLAAAGSRCRILATVAGADGTDRTHAIVTCHTDLAGPVAELLGTVNAQRTAILQRHLDVHDNPVCYLRRTLLATLDAVTGPAGNLDVLADLLSDPQAGCVLRAPVRWRSLVAPLTDERLSAAELRAVRDEIGATFDGTEDVLVPVRLSDGFGHFFAAYFANSWLTEEATGDRPAIQDEVLVDFAVDNAPSWQQCGSRTDPWVSSGYLLYEGLLAHLRCEYEAVEEACANWVDVYIHAPRLQQWLTRHRPDLRPRIDEAL